MSEQSVPKTPQRKWLGLFGALTLLGLAGAAGTPRALDAWAEARCERLTVDRESSPALEACTLAWERTGSPQAAASLALAHMQLRNVEEATRWADLPEARELPRARRARGYLLMVRNLRDEAQEEFERAIRDALVAGDVGEAGRAAHYLAGLHWASGRYASAFEAAEEAEGFAHEAKDGATAALALLAKADIYRHLGDAPLADDALEKAVEASEPWPSAQANALFKQGRFLVDRGMHGRAIAPLERAMALAEKTQNGWVLDSVTNILASLRAQEGDVAGARALLDRASPQMLARLDGLLMSAMIARAEGRFEDAIDKHKRAAAGALSPGEAMAVKTSLGNVHSERGQDDEAEAAWREAVAFAEKLSAAEPVYQGWVVARRREPFDKLFVHLVDRGRHAEAWEVLVRYTRAEALFTTPEHASGLRERLEAAEELRAAWQTSGFGTATVQTPSKLLAHRDVLVVHEAMDRLWVGVGGASRVHFSEVERSEDLARALHDFRGNASDDAAAGVLGEALWRTAGLSGSDEPLYIAATGRLRGLAFSALRTEGKFWMELRPLARLAHLDAEARVAEGWSPEIRVLGDPEENLPAARAEAEWVAGRLGVTAALGPSAGCGALLGAQGVSVLHLATHAEVGLAGARLRLAGCTVSPLDVLQHRPRARLVVLASCASTMGRETAGSDSLATAFLRAGSGAVLATTRSVPDEAAQRLVRAFYVHGGLEDPVRALRKAQLELGSELPTSVWSAFAVLLPPD